MRKTHYQVLGVPHTATKRDIRKRFIELTLKYHPDRLKSGTQQQNKDETFLQINEAHSVLSDDEKRLQYDKSLGLFNARPAFYFDTNPLFNSSSSSSSSRWSHLSGYEERWKWSESRKQEFDQSQQGRKNEQSDSTFRGTLQFGLLVTGCIILIVNMFREAD